MTCRTYYRAQVRDRDARSVLKKKFEAVDEMKSMLARMTNARKARRSTPHDRTKTSRSSEHRLCYRLRRRICFTSRKATRAVSDMHQNLSSWLAMIFKQVLLPSFHTSEMARWYFLEAAGDAIPETAAVRKRQIRRPTARAMLAQAHYRFKMLLKYKMERAGGQLVECEEEYTSKTCSGRGAIKTPHCLALFDRDVNAARNIFHKNMGLLL
ncbi:Transposase [Phytophthora megakarya]|uniref:Transposase n=1 Tax=Phytophthora megakarya TaxID=4795 RepID=A0A225X2R4_9STRA|nr:Transposase [Phytophthora megakarya]